MCIKSTLGTLKPGFRTVSISLHLAYIYSVFFKLSQVSTPKNAHPPPWAVKLWSFCWRVAFPVGPGRKRNSDLSLPGPAMVRSL